MKRFLIIIAAVALGVFALSACGNKDNPQQEEEQQDMWDRMYPNGKEIKDLEIKSTAMKQTMRYSVWLPPKFKAENSYPILYLLHGAGDTNNSWLENTTDMFGVHGGNAAAIAAKYVKANGVPMIIVMPDAQLTFYIGESGSYETFMFQELMPKVESEYKFSGKRAVAGLSMGGFGTLYYALTYPQKFTYAYAMSPATSINWLGINVTMDQMKEKAAALANVNPHAGFTIEVGNQDTTVSNADALVLSNAINQVTPCEWIARDGGHTWDFWRACLPKALQKAGESFK